MTAVGLLADCHDLQGWDISIVQHGFSKAPYGSARHQRRLKWSSYDV